MRVLLAMLFLAVVPSGVRADEAGSRSWLSVAGDAAYEAGKTANVILHRYGLPNGLKPEDGGDAPKATPKVDPVLSRAVVRGDGATPQAFVPASPPPPVLPPRLPGMRSTSAVENVLLGMNVRDLAASALSTGVVVGVAGHGCGTLGASLGPVVAGAAYFGCSWAGSYVADKGLRSFYDRMGWIPDEYAFGTGQIAGAVVGGWQAAHGLTSAATRGMLRGYGAVTSPTFRQALPQMARQFETMASRRVALGAVAGYFGLGGAA